MEVKIEFRGRVKTHRDVREVVKVKLFPPQTPPLPINNI